MLRSLAIALALCDAAVLPAAASGLSAAQTVERQVMLHGKPGWAPAMEADTGDRLRYTTRYINLGHEADGGAVLSMPVPPAVRYVEGTAIAGGAELTFSADGGRSFAAREALQLTGEAEITHIRWTFAAGIAPGESGALSFEAVVR